MSSKPMIYAKVLARAMSEADTAEQQTKIAKALLKLLEKRHILGRAKEIIGHAQYLLLRQKGNKKVILETARVMSKHHSLSSLIKKGDVVEEKLNPNIVAGIKIILDNEKQLDFSLKSKLDNVFS